MSGSRHEPVITDIGYYKNLNRKKIKTEKLQKQHKGSYSSTGKSCNNYEYPLS